MLTSYDQPISRLVFVFAHCGEKENRGCRVYSIAAVAISPGGDRKGFSSLVRYQGLRARDRCHSNISREMLADAPDAVEVSDRIRAFLKPDDVVFMLGEPDQIRHVMMYCGKSRGIDLGFAAEYFLPQLPSHSFRSLWDFLHHRKRDKISFSADDMVELSIGLVRYICGTRLNDALVPDAGAIRYYLNRSHTLFGVAFVHIARQFGSYFGGLFEADPTTDTDNWKQFLEKPACRTYRGPGSGGHVPVSLEHVDALFHGMAESGKGFAYRPEQVQFAGHVAGALNDGCVLTIEAGTGTGKTQGYLIPVLEFLYRNPGARAVISTYTKSLQEQIFQRELAVATDVFRHYSDIPVSLLKGKSSYICAVKLDNLYEETLSGPGLLAWLYFLILVLDFRHCDGDCAGTRIVHYLGRHVDIYHMLNEISAGNGCHSGHQRCPAQIVTAEASEARLIITNHHKLVLLDQDTRLSGVFRNYVIDEANHFEHSVRNAFGEEAASADILPIIEFLEQTAAKFLKKTAGECETSIRSALSRIDHLKLEISRLRTTLGKITAGFGNGEVHSLPCRHPAFENGHIRHHLDSMTATMTGLCSDFQWGRDPDTCRALKLQRRTAERIKTAVAQLGEYADALKLMGSLVESPGHVAAFQCFRKHWILMTHSVEVSDLIRHHIYDQKDAVVFTAATLTYKGSFDTFREITGMVPSEAEEQQPDETREFRFEKLPSPFPKDAAEIIVPSGAVSGKFDNKENWTNSVAAMLPDLIRHNRGRTLVLFSSYTDLTEIVQRVSASITESMYPVLVQRKGYPTVNLCDEFREIRESVLFGVDTFWYGVDFKGDTLTQVIITRIPYPSPHDPVQMARKRILPSGRYWKRYHYDTGIKLKQGVGRLIRCDTDRGKVLILDSRFKPQMLENSG